MPNPIDNPELYTSIVVGGVASPGQVTLSNHNRVIGWDVKKGAGQSGASITRTSEDPIEFTASFYLVRDDGIGVDDIAAWPSFLEVLRSTITGATPTARDIYHPDLADVGVKSVVLKEIGGVTYDGLGGETRVVKLLEYFPPKPKGGSPTGSKSKKPATPDPDAEALAELERLTNQYQTTPWG